MHLAEISPWKSLIVKTQAGGLANSPIIPATFKQLDFKSKEEYVLQLAAPAAHVACEYNYVFFRKNIIVETQVDTIALTELSPSPPHRSELENEVRAEWIFLDNCHTHHFSTCGDQSNIRELNQIPDELSMNQ